jgi:hypothetical protein
MGDLSYERRTGYRWLTDRPALLLSEAYPAWKQAQLPEKSDNMLLYVVLIVAVCGAAGTAIVGVKLWKQRREK